MPPEQPKSQQKIPETAPRSAKIPKREVLEVINAVIDGVNYELTRSKIPTIVTNGKWGTTEQSTLTAGFEPNIANNEMPHNEGWLAVFSSSDFLLGCTEYVRDSESGKMLVRSKDVFSKAANAKQTHDEMAVLLQKVRTAAKNNKRD